MSAGGGGQAQGLPIITQQGWDLGMITDRVHEKNSQYIARDNWLLYAQDVYMARGGEIRSRGGKKPVFTQLISGLTVTAVTSFYGSSCFSGIDNCSFIASVTASAATHLFGAPSFPQGAGQWKDLAARIDSAGATKDPYALFPQFAESGTEIVSAWSPNVPGIRWSGSYKAGYRTGTVSCTSGSRTITGTGTAWLANIEVGMYLYIDSGVETSLRQRRFKITNVISDTSLEVDYAPDATTAVARAYAINAVGNVSAPTGIFCDKTGTARNYMCADLVAHHRGRLWCAVTYEPSGTTYQKWGARVRWSATEPEAASGKFGGIDNWQSNAYIDVYPGRGGGDIVRIVPMDTGLVVIKPKGIYMIRGAVATDGTDLGARVDIISETVGIEEVGGVAIAPEGLYISSFDGAYLFDGSSLQCITDGSVSFYWKDQLAGYRPIVSVLRSRVVFQVRAGTQALLFDRKRQSWWVQSTGKSYTNIHWINIAGFDSEYALISNADGLDDWAYDEYRDSPAYASDPGGTTPLPYIVTQPFDFQGDVRPQLAYVDANVTTNALTCSIVSGSVYDDWSGQASSITTAAGSLPATNEDDEHRLRINGAIINDTHRIILTQAAGGNFQLFRISLAATPQRKNR